MKRAKTLLVAVFACDGEPYRSSTYMYHAVDPTAIVGVDSRLEIATDPIQDDDICYVRVAVVAVSWRDTSIAIVDSGPSANGCRLDELSLSFVCTLTVS